MWPFPTQHNTEKQTQQQLQQLQHTSTDKMSYSTRDDDLVNLEDIQDTVELPSFDNHMANLLSDAADDDIAFFTSNSSLQFFNPNRRLSEIRESMPVSRYNLAPLISQIVSKNADSDEEKDEVVTERKEQDEAGGKTATAPAMEPKKRYHTRSVNKTGVTNTDVIPNVRKSKNIVFLPKIKPSRPVVQDKKVVLPGNKKSKMTTDELHLQPLASKSLLSKSLTDASIALNSAKSTAQAVKRKRHGSLSKSADAKMVLSKEEKRKRDLFEFLNDNILEI